MGRLATWRGTLFLVSSTAVCLLILFTNQTSAQTAVLLSATPSPTPDRLAAPPTVPAPTLADEGAQLYWLHCQPCHGDVGQGLTDAPDDDWRAQYPEEDGNCWDSGCHGNRPYEEGFTLPKEVPAIIGEGSLTKFANANNLYSYIRVAMPLQAPATLADTEYQAVTAFLAASHRTLDGASLEDILTPASTNVTPDVAEPVAVPTAVPNLQPSNSPFPWLLAGGLLATLLLLIGGSIWLKQNR